MHVTSTPSLAPYTLLRKAMKNKVLSVCGCAVVSARNLREVGDWTLRKLEGASSTLLF
jgi:hypothetical protein